MGTNADIFFASNTVFGAIFILTAKLIEVVHDRFSKAKSFENQRLQGRNESCQIS